MPRFHSFADIAALFPSIAEAGRAIGVRPDTMRKYVRLNAVPARYLRGLALAARDRVGGESVSPETLCAIAARDERAL